VHPGQGRHYGPEVWVVTTIYVAILI
ncbi:hypothetical protein CCACVL1_01254, partial [Corchorus capsularis]